MATDTVLLKRTMLEAFKQKKSPTMFLSSFFRTPPRNITDKKKVVIDIKRNDEHIAVDVIRGTGGNLNNNKRFTTKEYEPPVYDEYTTLTDQELFDRMPGMTEYDEMSNAAQVLALVTDDQIEQQEKILRAIEKQAADVLFSGIVTLINNDTIDFKQKASHQIDASVAWNVPATANPIGDFINALDVNRKDGKVESKIAIFGADAWEDFLSVNKMEDRFNLRRVNKADIIPSSINDMGATFHGVFSVGSYELQAWTYPQFYLVPEGYGLPNEGTLVPYVPTDLVLVLPTPDQIRLDLVYAGIANITDRVDPRLRALGLTRIPTRARADFAPYVYTDVPSVSLKAGVRSAPLCIPTQIDGYSVIDTRP